MSRQSTGVSEKVDTILQEEIAFPSKYKVLVHNDNTTTYQCVIDILQYVFHMTFDQAMDLATKIDKSGKGVAGIYTQEIADEKVTEATLIARSQGFPLLITKEEL